MNFQDSVQSLLARLRAAQDEPPSGSSGGQGSQPPQASTSTSTSATPFSRQLGDLLSSLGKGDTSQTQASPPSQPGQSAFTGSTRSLIAPFGPVAETNTNRSPSQTTKSSIHDEKGKPIDTDPSEMSFTKALPLISVLLEDEEFRQEVKRMKVDQDTLERRLWAKSEKVKVEHEKTTRTDKEIARITGQDISPTKKQDWASQLEVNLQEFYRQNCLPSIDGLAARHRERLQVLGVSGLGGDMGDSRTRERVRKIMDVIEGGLDE